MRRLLGVADHPLDGIPSGHRKGVCGVVVGDQADQLLQLLEAEVGQSFLVGEGVLEAHGSLRWLDVAGRHGVGMREYERAALQLRNIPSIR